MNGTSRALLTGLLAVVMLTVLGIQSSWAQDAYIGEVRMVAFSFAPMNWLACEGQELQIAQYTALFSLLGTAYGGDGQTTFKLPDLRGGLKVGPAGLLVPLTRAGAQSSDRTVPIKFVICVAGVYPPRP